LTVGVNVSNLILQAKSTVAGGRGQARLAFALGFNCDCGKQMSTLFISIQSKQIKERERET